MKFRFCGGLDAPDWLLTEIAIVAKLSSQQMTFFTEQVIKQLLGKKLAYDKLEKLSQMVKFTRSDAKAALAAVNYVLDSATRYNVQRKILSTEMQQLGLHEDLTDAMLEVYFKKKDTILALYKQKEFKLETVKNLNWRVDCVLGSSNVKGMAEPNIILNIKGSNSNNDNDNISFNMSSNMFRVLHAELKNAHTMMAQMSGQD